MKTTTHLGLILHAVCVFSLPRTLQAQEPPAPSDAAPPPATTPSTPTPVSSGAASDPTVNPAAPAPDAPAARAEPADAKEPKDGEVSGATRHDGDPGDPWKGAPATMQSLGLSFRLLVQGRYRQTFGADSDNPDELYRVPENTLARDGDGWDLRRAFLGISAQPSKFLGLKMVLDIAELRHDNPKKVPKQAYVELRPLPKRLEILAGIVKLPYSIEELDPTARYELTSLGQANSLTNDLGFSGRDIGAEVIVSPLAKPRYLKLTAGAFRGQANDENASPIGAIGGRAQTEPVKWLRLGASFVMLPETVIENKVFDTSGKDRLPNPADPNYPRARRWEKGQAFAADVTLSRKGFMLRGEGMLGDRVDYDTRYGAKHWAAVWGLAAYKFDAGPLKLEPAVRAEWLDTDIDRKAGVFLQLTAGVGLHFNKATKLVLDVTRINVEDGTPVVDQPLPLREVPYNALSVTRATAQLQVSL
jgi:hypothetical protein